MFRSSSGKNDRLAVCEQRFDSSTGHYIRTKPAWWNGIHRSFKHSRFGMPVRVRQQVPNYRLKACKSRVTGPSVDNVAGDGPAD
jgi:hypothetical protein